MEKKKVLVSGAASGIGKATALRFAAEGWDVCLTDKNEEKLKDVFAELSTGEHLMYPADYTDKEAVCELEALIKGEWGTLTALVNCAGVYMSADAVHSPLEEWYRPMNIMMDGTVNVTRIAVPLIGSNGRIIHITSIHSRRAEKNSSAYAMAKAAIAQYCRGLSVELADKNILVNSIAPGFIDTPMGIVNGINELETEWFIQNYVNGHHLPLKRGGQPEEVAGVALFLAGEDASYITGQEIIVDGGLTATF